MNIVDKINQMNIDELLETFEYLIVNKSNMELNNYWELKGLVKRRIKEINGGK